MASLDRQSANEAAASPARPFPLGGKVYACSPPTISTMASLMALARRKCEKQSPLASLVTDPSFALLPLAAQVEAAKIATQAQVQGKKALDMEALAEQLLDPEVLAFGVWACLQPNHEGLDLETVQAGITEANAPEVFTRFMEASGMLSLSEKKVLGGASG